MSLLDEVSLLLTPNANATGKLYSIIPSNGNGDFTGTRATTATRVNSSGLVEVTGLNMIRRDYSLGSCPNILLEPQRTNIALRSEEFDNASWVKNQSSVTQNTTISPDGTSNADTLTANGVSSNYRINQNISLTTLTTYTFSIYAKKNTNDFIQWFGNSTILGSNFWANFDLNTGVVSTIGTSTTATITSVGNGWYRCTMTGTTIATGSSLTCSIQLVTSASAARGQTNSLTTSVFLWGAQVEVGNYASSYIPTTATTVTRNVDVITRNNVFTNNLITAAGGTWFIELRNNIDRIGDSPSRIGIGDTSSFLTNSLSLVPPGTLGRMNIVKTIAGVSTTLFVTTTTTVKIVIKWNGTTADVFVNGVKVVAATLFITTNMQFLGNSGLGAPVNINEMALFPTPLSDTRCIALTT